VFELDHWRGELSLKTEKVVYVKGKVKVVADAGSLQKHQEKQGDQQQYPKILNSIRWGKTWKYWEGGGPLVSHHHKKGEVVRLLQKPRTST